MGTVRNAIAIAITEIVIALGAFAIAPQFLNSKRPAVGFAIVLGVPMALGSSAAYALWRVADARRARALVWQVCPELTDLRVLDFIDIPADRVRQRLPDLRTIADDPDAPHLQLSPLDLLRDPRP